MTWSGMRPMAYANSIMFTRNIDRLTVVIVRCMFFGNRTLKNSSDVDSFVCNTV